MSENGITQELVRSFYDYKDGLLYNIDTGKVFGRVYSHGYRVGSFQGVTIKNCNMVWIYHNGPIVDGFLDHIDRVKDNDRIENLRITTNVQNQWNTGSYGGRSKYKGVNYQKDKNKWRARYKDHGQRFHIGYYATELEAAIAYDKAVEHLHGEYQVKNV